MQISHLALIGCLALSPALWCEEQDPQSTIVPKVGNTLTFDELPAPLKESILKHFPIEKVRNLSFPAPVAVPFDELPEEVQKKIIEKNDDAEGIVEKNVDVVVKGGDFDKLPEEVQKKIIQRLNDNIKSAGEDVVVDENGNEIIINVESIESGDVRLENPKEK
jgi:hypothetical protein